MGLRDQILASGASTRRESREVPEWGDVTVYAHELTAKEAQEWSKAAQGTGKRKKGAPAVNAGVDLCIRCLKDEDGEPIFTADDAEFLEEQPVRLLNGLVELCFEVNGFDKQGVARAKNG